MFIGILENNRLESNNYQSVTNITKTQFAGIQLAYTAANPWFGRGKGPSEVFNPWYIVKILLIGQDLYTFVKCNLHLHFKTYSNLIG